MIFSLYHEKTRFKNNLTIIPDMRIIEILKPCSIYSKLRFLVSAIGSYPYNYTCRFDRREKSLTICFIIRFLVALLLEMTPKMVSDAVGIFKKII